MDTKEFEKTYNDFQEAKKVSVVKIRWFSVSFIVVVVAVLIWSFSIQIRTIDNIIVTDQTGQQINSKVLNRKDLIETLIMNHCEVSMYYLNSFDRLNIKENQAKALFYINTKDASNIFNTYQTNGSYDDALRLGYTYETAFRAMELMEIGLNSHKVKFTGILTINELDKQSQFAIIATGEIITTTPQYPENKFGFYFKKYNQKYKRIANE